ncbi:MAG: peptidase M14 [Acidobacteria bacterium]|nr:peptidase M14 [Acidobacteriota bacterium]
MKNILLTIVGSLLALGTINAAAPLIPAETPPEPAFNRLSDFDEITALLKGYAAAYPKWVKLESIGKSTEGRDMWLLTLNNPATGDVLSKPAMYVDGNTHGNEIQGTEATLYTIDFLLKNYGRLDRVTELLDRASFYFVPVVNPDGRADWFAEPATANYPRTVKTPVDDDRDGLVDEDGYDDLDGDGVITQMRMKVPLGQGNYRLHPKDPRILVPIEKDEQGDYIELGYEGYDNDGDGRVNEDSAGYVDPNRSWGYGWQPRYVQNGAHHYPLSIPETRSIAVWALTAPNIAAVQTFHNSGGMILRGPGVASDVVRDDDVRVYDTIGQRGEEILPGYTYMVLWKDLYPVWGGELDWFYGARGILTFSNELWTSFNYFREEPQSERWDRVDYRFDRYLLFGEAIVPWTPIEHPQYGLIEVGGLKKQYSRAIPGFLLREEAHRNMAFTLYQADQLPLARVDSIDVRSLPGGLSEVRAIVSNRRLTPTRTAQDIEHGITPPDRVSIEGGRVIAGFRVEDPLLDRSVEQKYRPESIEVGHIPGMGTAVVKWVVRGSGPFTVSVVSAKGGVHSLNSR